MTMDTEPSFDLVEQTAQAIFKATNDGRAWADWPQDHLLSRDQARSAIKAILGHVVWFAEWPQTAPMDSANPPLPSESQTP